MMFQDIASLHGKLFLESGRTDFGAFRGDGGQFRGTD